MRDLLIITADADMAEVMRAILHRHQALGIRPVDYEVRRHDGRDAGLFREGPEMTRSLKREFQRVIVLWDYHGSGREHLEPPDSSESNIQRRLNDVSWTGNSFGIAITPELEEWLWHSDAAIWKWLNHRSESALNDWIAEFSALQGIPGSDLRQKAPKELFEFVCFKGHQRRPLPKDYSRIASAASLADWQQSRTFGMLNLRLRAWFPTQPPTV